MTKQGQEGTVPSARIWGFSPEELGMVPASSTRPAGCWGLFGFYPPGCQMSLTCSTLMG